MTYDDNEMKKMLGAFGNPLTIPYGSWKELLQDHFMLEDVVCYSGLGNTLEKYDRILFPKEPIQKCTLGKEIFTDKDNIENIQHKLSEEGKFLPSSMLLTTIINRLHRGEVTHRPEMEGDVSSNAKDLVKTVSNFFGHDGYLLTNSVVDYDNFMTHHYPSGEKIQEFFPNKIDETFNKDMQQSHPHFCSGFNVIFELDDPKDMKTQNRMLLESFFGCNDNALRFFEINNEQGKVFMINPNPDKTDKKQISIGSHLWASSDVNAFQGYTYCMVPPKGDYG